MSLEFGALLGERMNLGFGVLFGDRMNALGFGVESHIHHMACARNPEAPKSYSRERRLSRIGSAIMVWSSVLHVGA